MKNDKKTITMNGQEVEVEFIPNSANPLRKVDTGIMRMTLGGVVTEWPYVTTSFLPLPFPDPTV